MKTVFESGSFQIFTCEFCDDYHLIIKSENNPVIQVGLIKYRNSDNSYHLDFYGTNFKLFSEKEQSFIYVKSLLLSIFFVVASTPLPPVRVMGKEIISNNLVYIDKNGYNFLGVYIKTDNPIDKITCCLQILQTVVFELNK